VMQEILLPGSVQAQAQLYSVSLIITLFIVHVEAGEEIKVAEGFEVKMKVKTDERTYI
jgi:hypothetical protein